MFKIFLYCVLVIHTALGQSYQFGTPHLKGSVLCQPWKCVNEKLGFSDHLPPKDQFVATLKSLLPEGPWQQVASQVAEKCYGDRPRTYTSSCPGQELVHCAVDQMNALCPEDSLKKEHACTPLVSIAGFKYMFQQSSNCCDLPEIFNSTLLKGCGFNSMIKGHDGFNAKTDTVYGDLKNNKDQRLIAKGSVTVTNLKDSVPKVTTHVHKSLIVDGGVKVVDLNELGSNTDQDLDPLECCNLSGFIEPSWISECGFNMNFNERYRLTIRNNTERVVTTTTTAPSTTTRPKYNDVKILPQSCEKETCVFRSLNVISESGSLDLDAYSKLLDNFTRAHPSWTKAKARVVTKCLSRPIRDYIDDCEINKVLACTFDILSENCPHAQKNDACKHSTVLKQAMTCQISSSKLRPKYRRQFCGLPSLVDHDVLSQCGLTSLTRMEFVPDPVTARPKAHWWTKPRMVCESTNDVTKCLLSKMGVLNKYGFLDYFKMKDRIRALTSSKPEWSALTDVYISTFTASPMYTQQCTTPKKLLNVLDVMLRTCPLAKRTFGLECNRVLTDMAITASGNQPFYSKFMLHRGLNPMNHHFSFPPVYSGNIPALSIKPVIRKTQTYDFGILNSNGAPKVEVIDVKRTTYKPLVMSPDYMRMYNTSYGSALVTSNGVTVTPLHTLMPVYQTK